MSVLLQGVGADLRFYRRLVVNFCLPLGDGRERSRCEPEPDAAPAAEAVIIARQPAE